MESHRPCRTEVAYYDEQVADEPENTLQRRLRIEETAEADGVVAVCAPVPPRGEEQMIFEENPEMKLADAFGLVQE